MVRLAASDYDHTCFVPNLAKLKRWNDDSPWPVGRVAD